MEFRTAEIEHRADDGVVTVTGLALPYGSEADLPWGRERVTAGAVRYADRGVIANLQHARERVLGRHPGNLTLTDTAAGLRFALELPDTTDGRDAGVLVRQGILGGASVEFVAVRERFEGDVRILDEVRLHGLALVDTPAYSDALIAEARHQHFLRTYSSELKGQIAWLGV